MDEKLPCGNYSTCDLGLKKGLDEQCGFDVKVDA